MRATVLALLPLAACAHQQACAPVVMQPPPQIEVVEKVVVVREAPAHAVLLGDYDRALTSERPIVARAKTPKTIDQLIALNTAARAAFVPIESPTHRATVAEINRAMAALAALQGYVRGKH